MKKTIEKLDSFELVILAVAGLIAFVEVAHYYYTLFKGLL